MSSGFIVLGISAQTFPSFLVEPTQTATGEYQLEALVACAESQSCSMTVEQYAELYRLESEYQASRTPLDKFRSRYPQYNDLSDDDVARRLHKTHFANTDWSVFWTGIHTPGSEWGSKLLDVVSDQK